MQVYDKLVNLQGGTGALKFETVATLSLHHPKPRDFGKRKQLRNIFCPDKHGHINLVDFVQSIDCIYKRQLLLCRSMENFAAIDRAYERLINIVFFAFVVVVALVLLGFDPLAFILALSALIVSLTFLIGPAASVCFEGMLMILLRAPYEIGDRIVISAPDAAKEKTAMAAWIVEDIDIYTTTVMSASTGEVATLSNGTLARSTIVNLNRSKKALLTVILRFSIETPHEKIAILKKAIEMFVKNRPRVRLNSGIWLRLH